MIANKLRWFVGALCILIFSIASGNEIYRCQKGSEIEYQAGPCEEGAAQTKMEPKLPQSIEMVPVTEGQQKAIDKHLFEGEGNSKKIVLTREKDSHFYIDGDVNGLTVHFLIDTGASLVAIPAEIAAQAGLRNGKQIVNGTSSGYVNNFVTVIDKLSLESFTFTAVDATIVTGPQALLGMNVLEKFDISQKDNELVLTYKAGS